MYWECTGNLVFGSHCGSLFLLFAIVCAPRKRGSTAQMARNKDRYSNIKGGSSLKRGPVTWKYCVSHLSRAGNVLRHGTPWVDCALGDFWPLRVDLWELSTLKSNVMPRNISLAVLQITGSNFLRSRVLPEHTL